MRHRKTKLEWHTVGPAALLEVTTCLVFLLTRRELLNSCKTGTDSKKYNTMAGIGVLTSCAEYTQETRKLTAMVGS